MTTTPIVEPFQVRIEALSPVHIGSGDVVLPILFHHNADKQRLSVTSLNKLLGVAAGDAGRLKDLDRHFLALEPSLIALLRKWQVYLRDVAAYSLPCEQPVDELRTFIRTHDGAGAAYLPGSSMKGAVRSGIARAAYLGNPAWLEALQLDLNTFAYEMDNRRTQSRLSQQIERRIFGEDGNTDLMRLIQIGDAPLPATSMGVCAVKVMSSQGDHTLRAKKTPGAGPNGKEIEVFVESLLPGQAVTAHWRVLQHLTSPPAASRLSHIAQHSGLVTEWWSAVRQASQDLIQQEIAFYEAHPRDALAISMANWFDALLQDPAYAEGSTCVLPVGWGSGFDAKTVTDLADDDTLERATNAARYTQRMGKPSGTRDWLGADLAPKTRKVARWNGQDWPLGWLKVTAEQV